jgi:hypothetical protein
VSALALSIARLRQRGTKRRVRRDGLAEAEKNKHARNTATRPRRYLEPDARSFVVYAGRISPTRAKSFRVCILFFFSGAVAAWLICLSLSSVAQARGWTGCTSVIDNPSDTLSKHQPRGGLETSFQKSKITRGAVTPSADLHTRAHCRQGPEAYSVLHPRRERHSTGRVAARPSARVPTVRQLEMAVCGRGGSTQSPTCACSHSPTLPADEQRMCVRCRAARHRGETL